MQACVPKSPPAGWLDRYAYAGLLAAKAYSLDESKLPFKLDQNESPFDCPPELKAKICQKLLESPWHRYPPPYAENVIKQLAAYAGLSSEHLMIGPGSNHLLFLLLHIFTARLRGKLVIARPSFPLYESYCQTHDTPYVCWDLDKNFAYDLASLPALPAGSLVVFASPNNPVGNILPYEAFERLLQQNPDSLFIADEAYYEFTANPYTPLLAKYSNLILVRTLSKAMGLAGVRLGYILASREVISLVRKMSLPYLVNNFTMIAISEILADAALPARIKAQAQEVCGERERLFTALCQLGHTQGFQLIPSHANFLLLRWPSQAACQQAYQMLQTHGILCRNVSAGPLLSGCLRLTVGSSEENAHCLKVFATHLSRLP